MLDPKCLRQEITATAERMRSRGYVLDIKRIQELEEKRKKLQSDTQDLQNKRNQYSKQIGHLKAKGEDASGLLAEMGQIGDALKQQEHELTELQQVLKQSYATIPNLPDPSVPVGEDETANQVVRQWGKPREFSF